MAEEKTGSRIRPPGEKSNHFLSTVVLEGTAVLFYSTKSDTAHRARAPPVSEICPHQISETEVCRMKRQFYIRNATDGHWQKVNGREFYDIVHSPAGQGRYFIDLDGIVFETSEAMYSDWKKEKNHSDYLAKQAEGWEELSMYTDDIGRYKGLEGCENGEEILADESVDVEEDAVHNMEIAALRLALKALDAASYQLIYDLYLAEQRKSEYELAVEYGTSRNAIHRRKNRIFKNIKNLGVAKGKKSQQ